MAGLTFAPRHPGYVAVVWRFRIGAAACLAATVAGAGCRHSSPDVTPVRGQVTLAGQPVVMMDVVFHPLPGTPGGGAVGRTGTDGRFDMVAVVGGVTKVLKGARPGRYRIALAEPELFASDGTPLPRPKAADAVTIPRRYMDATDSPLEVEVIAGMPDVVLELQSK